MEEPKNDVFEELKTSCEQIIELFKSSSYLTKENNAPRITAALEVTTYNVDQAKKLIEKIEGFASDYDFNGIRGNGYWSFVKVTRSACRHSLNSCKTLQNAVSSIVFVRSGYFVKELENNCQLLASICTCLEYLVLLREWSHEGELFSEHSAEELFEKGDTINQYCFYGRSLGFQYSDSMRHILKFISIGMASFSESYYSESSGTIAKTTKSLWSSGKYLWNPEQRAKRIVNISQNANVDFCKSFWFLAESELMQAIPSIVGSSLKVNKVIQIPCEPFSLPKSEGDNIQIPPPKSHLGLNPIAVRLLSTCKREGMIGESSRWRKMKEPSSSLILHCHGGGFVAQSSKSHELYLRDWAQSLDIPILSVDYSLAPEAPFPRALEEAFFAYAWAVKHCESLGSTGQKIILAGDSAGANLCLCIALKCVEYGIRMPDGIFIAYCPVLVSFVPSPARMLCLMDPLLPFGFMMRCLQAYTSPDPQVLIDNQERREALDDIKSASCNNITYSLDHGSPAQQTVKSPTMSSITADNNNELSLVNDDESYDNTFASASNQNGIGSNETSDECSNLSFISYDSQPIRIHMPISVDSSMEFVEDFLEKYVEEGPVDETKITPTISKTMSEENLFTETGKDVLNGQFLGTKVNNALGWFSGFMKSSEIKCRNQNDRIRNLKNLDALIARSPSVEFAFTVPKDPYLSPYWAADEVLRKFPKVSILTVDMDPCLDDCVEFAKKLQRLDKEVTLDILEGLPHGFLNFTKFSKEAMEGSKQCILRLKELLSTN